MALREGEYVKLPTAPVRLELGRPAGQGLPRAEVRALLNGKGGENAVRHEDGGVNDGFAVDILTVDLASLESAVNSVRVVLATEAGPTGDLAEGGAGRSAGEAAGIRLRVLAEGADGPVEFARVDWAGAAGGGEYVLGECYREGGGWHFRAVVRPLPARRAEAAAAVTLTAAAPAVSLTRQGATSGTLRIGPLWQGVPEGLGIDLCALFELSDGSKGVVQSLGGAYGSLARPPFLLLGGDEHTGEQLTVNLDRGAYFRRVLVFAAVFEDPLGFEDLHGTVTLRPEHGAAVDFTLDVCEVPSTVCALALLTRDGAELVVRREARYLLPRPGVSPQRTVDYAYGWGLNWTPDRAARK